MEHIWDSDSKRSTVRRMNQLLSKSSLRQIIVFGLTRLQSASIWVYTGQPWWIRRSSAHWLV